MIPKTTTPPGTVTPGKVKIKWDDIVPIAEKAARKLKKTVGTASNLRGIFYALVATEFLPNTIAAYKGLSKCLSKARKNDSFPWNLIQDSTRATYNHERNPKTVEMLERWGRDYATDALEEIRDQLNQIKNPDFDYAAFKWEGQRKRLVICCEKEGGAKAIASLTKKWRVEVNATRGYSSTTHLRELALRLRDLADIEGVEALEVILVTDFDPSGEDIVRFTRETLRDAFGINANVHKILVTRDQIDEHNLPPAPAKRSDTRLDKFMRDTGSDEVVELDAMLAIVPEAFKSCLNDEIARHFDETIETEVADKVGDIQKRAEDDMNALAEKLGDIPALVENLLAQYGMED